MSGEAPALNAPERADRPRRCGDRMRSPTSDVRTFRAWLDALPQSVMRANGIALQLSPDAGRGGRADFVKRKRPNFRHGNAVRCEAMPARKVKIYP